MLWRWFNAHVCTIAGVMDVGEDVTWHLAFHAVPVILHCQCVVLWLQNVAMSMAGEYQVPTY